AWDGGDYSTAAGKWEALLRVHGLDPEIDKVIRPLAKEARSRAGGAAAAPRWRAPDPRPSIAPRAARATRAAAAGRTRSGRASLQRPRLGQRRRLGRRPGRSGRRGHLAEADRWRDAAAVAGAR